MNPPTWLVRPSHWGHPGADRGRAIRAHSDSGRSKV